ncbi:MAG TPA: hypothetical protein VJ984_12870 [Xanthomonadales bacterium]|nr:hypothetical protein [Xanthomonadales bacterium]
MKNTLILLLLSAGMLGGCASTTTIDDYRPTTELIRISSEEKVAVLGRRDAGHYETDGKFIECIGNQLDGSHFEVVGEQEFVDALYPWFEPRTAPKGIKRLRKLMNDPYIKARVNERNIRYLVWLDGEVESAGHTGTMSCGMGPTGAGCFGYASWDKNVFFEAVVWDLMDVTEEARIRVDAEGTSYVIGIVAPIPLISPVKSQACQGMGDKLKSYFSEATG